MTIKYGRSGQIDTGNNLVPVLGGNGEPANFIPWGGAWSNELKSSDGKYRFLKTGTASGRGNGNALDAILADNFTLLALIRIQKRTGYDAISIKLGIGTTVGFSFQTRPLTSNNGEIYVRSDYVISGNQAVASHNSPIGKEQDKQWHWVGFSRGNGTSFKAYQDGAISTSTGTAGSWQNTLNLSIGNASGVFEIACVLVFNRVLSDAEAQQIQRGQIKPNAVPGLVGYYKFNETHGNASGQCTDYSGAGNHLTYTGAAWEIYDPASTAKTNFASGQPYPPITLLDTTQWWNRRPAANARPESQGCIANGGVVPYNALMNLTADISYGGWAKVNRFRQSQTFCYVLFSQYVTAVGPIAIQLINSGKTCRVTIGNTSSATHSDFALDKPVPLGVFTHYFATLSGNTVSIYINGKLIGTAANAAAHGGSPSANWILGADNTEKSMVRGIRLFSRAISAEEVANLFHTDQCLNRTGLVAEWLCDNVHETIVRDTSGNGLNSNTTSAQRSIDSPYQMPRKKRFGKQFRAFGGSQYAQGSCAAVNNKSVLTIAHWRKNTNVPVGSANRVGVVFGSGGSSIVAIAGDSSNRLAAFVRSVTSDTPQTIVIPAAFSSGAEPWVHWAVTADYAAKTITVYKNGVKIISVAMTGTFQNAIFDAGTPQVQIGNIGTDTSRAGFDSVRIYDRALTDAEHMALYLDNNVKRTGLLAEYLFDNDTIPTTVIDSSGNNYNLAGSGTTSANWVQEL